MDIKQIATLIKENKLEFKYGEAKPNKSEVTIYPDGVISLEGSIFYKQPLEIFYNQIIGYVKIDDLFVCQTVKYDLKLRRIVVKYGILKDLEIEKKLPKVNFKLLKIYFLLIEWQGEFSIIHNHEQNRSKFLYLIEHIGVPQEYRQCKNPLYRGINLSPIAIKKIKKGKPITLQDRKFSSWSESKSKATQFVGTDDYYSQGLLLQYSPTTEVLINIPLFYKEVFDTVSPYGLNKEKEVILINSAKMKVVQPKQVIFTKKLVPSLYKWKRMGKIEKEFINVKLLSNFTKARKAAIKKSRDPNIRFAYYIDNPDDEDAKHDKDFDIRFVYYKKHRNDIDALDDPHPGIRRIYEDYKHHEFQRMVAKAILKAIAEEELELYSINKVEKIIPKLVKAAQKIYNKWNEKNIDTYAGGGICHLIADEFCDVLWKNKIPCSTVSSDYEQHVYTIVQVKEGIYKVDIHPSMYETGGGFTWKKIKHVKFSNDDVYFYKISSKPDEFDEYIGD